MFKTLALTVALLTTPALANAGNTAQNLSGESFWTVKDRISSEIGNTHAISTVWDCGYTRCEKRIAEWYLPERSLYVRLEGGVMATRLVYGTRCENPDCASLARLTR